MARLALVDGASFVLPYDHALATGLLRRGVALDFYGSRTRYNAEFLADLQRHEGLTTVIDAVSGSVCSRPRGVLGYLRLLLTLLWRGRRYDAINLQFSVLWPLELLLLFPLRRRLVYTVHNAVPHGHAGRRHRPTAWLAALAGRLVFVSEATRDDFLARYGSRHRARSSVLPHGLLPVHPGQTPCRPKVPVPPEALVFWGTVKGYKGVDLFLDLAVHPALRGLPLEIVGAWDPALAPLRADLAARGVHIRDDYLDPAALDALLARPVVFLLPYRAASQSGALYTLLHRGCTFLCSDVGDLGAFLRESGLDALRLRERSAEAVVEALDRLARDPDRLADALAAAQQRHHWDRCLAPWAEAHGLPPQPSESSPCAS